MAKSKPAPAKPTTAKLTDLEKTEVAALEIRLRQLRGEFVTVAQVKLLDRWTKKQFEAIREASLRELPKGIYCQLAGRQNKVVDEFGIRYDVPLTGPTVNLAEVVRLLHSRVSELAEAARPFLDSSDAELHREKLRREIQKLERQSEVLKIDIQTRLNELVSKTSVRERLEWLSGKMQALGARLHRIAGSDAQRALNEFLDDLATEIDGGTLAV